MHLNSAFLSLNGIYSSFHLVPRCREAWASCYGVESQPTATLRFLSPPLSDMSSLPPTPPPSWLPPSPSLSVKSLTPDHVVILQTHYDAVLPENKKPPEFMHDREKNTIWTQDERVRASRADVPVNLQDLENKVLCLLRISYIVLKQRLQSFRKCTEMARNPASLRTFRCPLGLLSGSNSQSQRYMLMEHQGYSYNPRARRLSARMCLHCYA